MGRTSFYLSKEQEARLRIGPDRGVSAAINEIMDRYQYLIDTERGKLRMLFSQEEWDGILSATWSTLWQPAGIIRGGVLADVEDSLEDELQGADKEKLVEKLRELTPIQQFSLVEILEEKREKLTERV